MSINCTNDVLKFENIAAIWGFDFFGNLKEERGGGCDEQDEADKMKKQEEKEKKQMVKEEKE